MKRCTRQNPCRICGKDGWCCYTDEGLAHCMRVDDAPEGWKVASRSPNGATNFLPEGFVQREARVEPKPGPMKPVVDWDGLNRKFYESCSFDLADKLAQELELNADDLRMVGLGYAPGHDAFTFPMFDAKNRACGIRLRSRTTNKKYAIKGSSDGVFGIPLPCPEGRPILVCEGPTDTAAMIQVGFYAYGRPSCRGAVITTKTLTKGRDVVIVSDSDSPGRAGAAALADALHRTCSSVRIIEPLKGKDAREWVASGATKDIVEFTINQAKECCGNEVQSIEA